MGCRRCVSGIGVERRRAALPRAEQSAQEVQLAVRLEHTPKNRCCFIGWNLDGVNRTATASRMDNGRLAGRPKVSGPARCSVARLDIRVSIEVEHRDRRRALNTRPAPAHNQEDVRGTGRHPAGIMRRASGLTSRKNPGQSARGSLAGRSMDDHLSSAVTPLCVELRLKVAPQPTSGGSIERPRMDAKGSRPGEPSAGTPRPCATRRAVGRGRRAAITPPRTPAAPRLSWASWKSQMRS